MKKAFKFIFVVVLLALSFSIITSAETYSGICGVNVTWLVDTETNVLKISGTGDMAHYGPASSNQPWYGLSSYIKTVTISSGVTSISVSAFKDCRYLTSIDIPASVTSIGAQAFNGCERLTSIDIPDSVTSIGSQAFYGCEGLTSIDIPESVTSIGNAAFYGCNDLESITFSEKLTQIGDFVCYNCDSLTSIDIPEGVINIGDRAFGDCDRLRKITIPSSVTNISSAAFNFSNQVTIHGYSGSYAEEYANNNSIAFVAVAENNSIIMTIDSTDATVFGQAAKTDVPPIIENDRTMLPARFVAEALGATVVWDGTTRTATIDGNGVTIKITVDSSIAYIDDEAVTLDAPAFIRNDRTYTPVRFIAEALGATVEWNGSARQAIITKQ